MSTTSSAGAFNPTLDELRTIQAGKYLLACALTTTLYDIFICLDQEWKLIWTKTSTPKATKAAFGLLRYGVAIGLCYVVYVVLGLRKSSQNENICKTFFEFAFIVVTLTSMIANSYIVYHHYILWEKRRIILIIMSTISIICYIPTLAMAIMSAVAYRDISRYDPIFNACIYPKRPKSVNAYFTILTTFDLLTIGVAVLNSVDRPYRQYGEVISNILRDGSLYFLALVTIRLINTVLSFILPPQESFLISFNVWGMISIILSRFMLRVEGLRAHNEPKGSIRIWNDHSEAFELNRWDTSSGRR